MMHRKLWIFDDILGCVASMNPTYNSTYYCSECGVFFVEAECVMYLASEFQLDWEKSEPLRLTGDGRLDIMMDYTGRRLTLDGQFVGNVLGCHVVLRLLGLVAESVVGLATVAV